jgi:predicted Co/Zn/Cd cation transporter (cation efflux family)
MPGNFAIHHPAETACPQSSCRRNRRSGRISGERGQLPVAGNPLTRNSGLQFSTMPMNRKSKERSLLLFSVWMGVLFTVLGISWGLAIQSGVILFDGIYSGFSIILSLLSILALRLINQPDDDTFQFGRMAFEPLVVALKSTVIIGVCVYGIGTSTVAILHGGSTATSSLFGMVYALVSIAACLFSWYHLKTNGADMPDLVQAESELWLMDTVFSGVVLASFLAGYLLSHTRLKGVVPYIDPGIVVLASVYFVRVPLARFISSMRELLLMAPTGDIQEQLKTHIDAIARTHHFPAVVVRSTKVGRELAVDIAFLAPADSGKVDIEELDRIRAEVEESLSGLGFILWMNILFTRDRRWA